MAFNRAKALQEAEKLVAQGKTSLAIKQYLEIIENDPSDLNLFNTVGDLYLLEKNIPGALKQFNALADAYVREGFTVKAIAIYKKITKLDRGSAEPALKLAELYASQGLSREAHENFSLGVDFYRKRKQEDKVLELLRRIAQVDPENPVSRARLAEAYERAGQKAEAAQAYLDSAQTALRHGESAAVELALKKATSLDPKSPHLRVFKARAALAAGRPQEAEKLLASVPELNDDPTVRELLLQAYLATRQIEKAQSLVLGVYRANPADFGALASYVAICIEKGNADAAVKPLLEVADGLIEQRNTGPLMDVLRQIWSKDPQHLPTLELLRRVCEQAGDELTLPDVLEALGHAYVQRGELEKAESAFEKLAQREPGNEHYAGLLRQVVQKQGKEFVAPSPAALAQVELAPAADVVQEPVEPRPALPAEEETAVKEALENSDLFARYGLVEKAVAELEKVLEVYPDQVDLHERILEISQRSNPARAGVAAVALARIYHQRGDSASARRYEETARSHGASIPQVEPRRKTAEFDLNTGLAPGEPEPAASGPEKTPSRGVPLNRVEGMMPGVEVGAAAEGLDLSADLAALSSPSAAEQAPTSFNYEEARVEVDFYLDQGFADEARKTVELYETKFPGNPQVGALRRQVEEHAARAAAAEPSLAEGPAEVVSQPPPPPAASGSARPPIPASVAESRTKSPSVLRSLADDLASSLNGLAESAPKRPAAPSHTARGAGTAADSAAALSGLLEELAEPADAQGAEGDPETHYSLGVAFREMGLLDEAIGEFQKVVRSPRKDKLPPHFLQACTLLASSFMEKKMPAIAAKWYLRAREAPNLDEEATLALQYDLGVAYEHAGEIRPALEKFMEVYSQNIDYRDVAEKIRLLQQKVS